MLSNNVGTEINQGQAGLFFACRIIPGVGPDNFYFRIWVNGANAKGESINAADNFRNRESCNITDYVALGLFAGNDTGQIAGFVHTAEIGSYIRSCFVAGAMQKSNIRIFFCYVDCWVHETEAGGKDDFVALRCQLGDNTFSVSTGWYRFNEAGLYIRHIFFDILTAKIMSHGITTVIS